ncbi:MAG TPA: DivIVA domain-containing protein [Gaiellaceae bacterium]|nr:DivIVA domain-containing protein [Gaiellaceae bacterium]
MALTPVEIRHVRFSRRLLGYRRSAVEQVLLDVADSFEDVWRSRADLADRVEHLESELVRYKELEALLRTTLVSAERTAGELRAQARREAGLVVDEAHAEARAITREAAGERERLAREAARVRALLRAALDAVEDADAGGDGAEDAVGPPGRWEAA